MSLLRGFAPVLGTAGYLLSLEILETVIIAKEITTGV
jgi:hypothetical protein